jgi:gluconate 2-dehydrogenase gamma chain
VSDNELTRRDAIKSFGLVGIAASLEVSLPHLERATTAVAELAQQQPAYVPKFFTRHEWQTVRVLVDYIIPKDGRTGSATDAKVPEFMDWLLADKEMSEATRVANRGGLAWLDEECRSRFQKTFVAASDAQRRAVLDDIAYPQRAPAGMSHGVSFFSRFRDFTASGFYSSAMGWKDLQYMGNVSRPEFPGCPQPALDKLGVSYDLMNSRVGINK